jgi:hypothetical protein
MRLMGILKLVSSILGMWRHVALSMVFHAVGTQAAIRGHKWRMNTQFWFPDYGDFTV